MNRLGSALAVAAVASALLVAPASAASALENPEDRPKIDGGEYAGDPAAEALLVAAEDRRLIDMRAVSNAAQWTGVNQYRPYRVVTGNTYTLILTGREADYSFDDLRELSPRTLVRQPDGSYLLSENIVVEEGATLTLRDDDGLVLHLASSPDRFVSIVTVGGSLSIEGTAEQPIDISSWNDDTGEVDADTTDGRAYIRVIGGHAGFSNVDFHDLGFWSGMTGGVSLTGTELPAEAGVDGTEVSDRGDLPIEEAEGNPTVFGTEILPAGEGAEIVDLEPDLSGYSYVSASVDSVSFSRNAFGLFVTSAEGVDVRNSRVEDSMVDGLVFHRNVKNSRVTSTEAVDNAVDGLVLSRATTGVKLDAVTSTGNGRNGVALDGRPLADGPSATGNSTGIYGNNEVMNSTIEDNGRYGIDVVGGTNLTLSGNTVTGHEMGIVVRDGVEKIAVRNNTVEDSLEQGIAFRDAVTEADISGNTVIGGTVGIYLRDSYGVIDRNVVEEVSSHAVTLIGTAATTTVSDNTIAGSGPSGIDRARAGDTILEDNDTTGWRSTKPLDVILRSIFQPLTVMWLILGSLVLITAITSLRRKRTGISHPYANLAPMSTLTQGVVTPQEAGVGLHHRVTNIIRDGRPGSAETEVTS